MKNLRLYNVSIHINFYPDRFLNECARKKKSKLAEYRNYVKTLFFVSYRRTYDLNN